MKEESSMLILRKGILWITVCQQIRQLGWNKQVSRKAQTTETDSKGNKNLNRH